MSFFNGKSTYTMEEKSRIIADAIASRRGRRQLSGSMLYPMGYRPEDDPMSCHNCALAKVKECEEIRKSDSDTDCWMPTGRLFVWDDKQEQGEHGNG